MTRHRALFISDCHLGSTRSRVDSLRKFLAENEADVLYLVGDVFEGSGQRAMDSLASLLHLMPRFSRIVAAHGNHDLWIRKFAGEYGRLTVLKDATLHTTLDGRTFAVTHGHCYDWLTRRAMWLGVVGSALDAAMYALGDFVRRATGSTAIHRLRSRANCALNALITSGRRDEQIIRECRDRSLCGVITGHFHEPGIRAVGDFLHADCGDWIDGCSAIAEDEQGVLRLIR